MLRHLPPAATPITLADLKRSPETSAQARSHFQAALADYFGTHVCGLASSGRTALYVLLTCLAATKPSRRRVLLPAYTCPALIKVILDAALQPCLVDISPTTFAFEPEQLGSLLSEQTLAVICAPPFGLPQNINEVLRLAERVGAVVIEDAAQSMGARLKGQYAGTQGDFGLFSLGPGKPLSTGGGGVLCARSVDGLTRAVEQTMANLAAPSPVAESGALLRLLLLYVLFQPRGWWLATRLKLQRIGDHEASWGYRQRALTETQAALGLKLLKRFEAINQHRRDRAGQLMARLQPLDFIHLPRLDQAAEPIYLRLPILVDDAARREQLFQALWQAGIGVGRMYGRPLSDIFPQLAAGRYPGAERLARHLLTLPTHHYLTGADITRIVQIFEGFNR